MYRFSAIYQPTALFSLKNSNATNSGAKSLFLPSPYSIKMAILNQAITVGNDEKILSSKNSIHFATIKDAVITYALSSENSFCINNAFIKILKPKRDDIGFQETVAFREYVSISGNLEIIFEVRNEMEATYLKKYLYKINYFGKRGCFFQFLKYSDGIKESNVKVFDARQLSAGILQEYDDFPTEATFEKVSNYSSESIKRQKKIMVLPIKLKSSSKSFSHYQFNS